MHHRIQSHAVAVLRSGSVVLATRGENIRLRIGRLKLGAMNVGQSSDLTKSILLRGYRTATAERRRCHVSLLAPVQAGLMHGLTLDRIPLRQANGRAFFLRVDPGLALFPIHLRRLVWVSSLPERTAGAEEPAATNDSPGNEEEVANHHDCQFQS